MKNIDLQQVDLQQIDLHVHSNRSDGTFSPSELVDYAKEKGLKAFALTDHDTVDGLEEAMEYAQKLRQDALSGKDVSDSTDASAGNTHISTNNDIENVPQIIPGIEFSTEYQGKDIHILGLFIDYKNKAFQNKLREFVDSRDLRNQKMCALLQEAGFDITYEKLLAEFPDAVITRAHYAKYLLNHGYINSLHEAFERYIGDRCPYFVPREKVTPTQAVQLILEADGIPILAHPVLYRFSDRRLETLVAELKEAGLMGIEAIYSTYNVAEERQMRKLADKHHLLLSGGSDFHGTNKPGLDLGCGYGKLFIPASILEEMEKSRKNLLFTDMDGTLLSNDTSVSPAMKDALKRMTNAGHHLILTTGRPLPGILSVCENLGLMKGITPLVPNMFMITNNGAMVYDCDKQSPVLEHKISQKDIAYFVQKAKEAGLHIHGYTDTEIITGNENGEIENDELLFYRRRIKMPIRYVKDIAAALPDGTYKLQVIHLRDKKVLERFRESLLDYCSDRIQMIFSNDKYLELLPAQAGKGNALKFVTDYLPAMHSHTFAAGDAENDISMLQAAHVGIAMQNAAPKVKAVADIVTRDDNEHDGLIEVLKRYLG